MIHAVVSPKLRDLLVLPKCLLTWGYVKVDAAAFCLQHDDRHGESAGPVEI